MQDLEYGIIGNCATCALVHKDSSIDWLCFPRFDSPSIFARILDEKKGGQFAIRPSGDFTIKQEYVKNTNVILTSFSSKEWEFELYDYFPHYDIGSSLYKDSEIHRVLKLKRGFPKIRFEIKPNFNYASITPEKRVGNGVIEFRNTKGNESIYLYSDMDINKVSDGSEILLESDSYIILTYNKIKPEHTILEVESELEKTKSYWNSWVSKAKLPTKYHDQVARSALALRLLTYDESGAIIAAATTSIPEIIGDVRNWDYRYCWIRDSSFTVMSLINLSRFDVANEFLRWMLSLHKTYGINLQVLFGINGERELKEYKLDYLEGYKGSKPVRIGNAAAVQRQVDIFGELLDAIHLLYVKHKESFKLNKSDWELVYGLVESAIKEWRYKDHSIWEFRTLSRHYTFSKVLCWVALDRGVKIADAFGMGKYSKRWSKIREEIKTDILENGWNEKAKAFTQSYGSEELDASLLLLPYFGFLSPKDKKIKSTVNAIGEKLFKDGFVMRYNSADDFGMPKNALIACTFWYVDALYMTGRKREAKELFESLLKHTNNLGLLPEDISRQDGELLGNFPQAYSHIALINSAVLLFGEHD